MLETHFQTTSQAIVNLAAASLSAAPHLTETERATRFQTVVRGTMEFQPADPAQTVLASVILGHYLTIMDGFRELTCRTLTPAEAARARMVSVAQTKVVPLLLREMRIEREAALIRAAAEAGEPDHGPTWGSTTRGPGKGAAVGAVADAAHDASLHAPLAQYLPAGTATLAAPENADPLTPAAAVKAREALDPAMPSGLFATSGEVTENADPLPPPATPRAPEPRDQAISPGLSREVSPVPAPLVGNRAQRRAMMKQNGGFKRHT
jgi:hypothetical protein